MKISQLLETENTHQTTAMTKLSDFMDDLAAFIEENVDDFELVFGQLKKQGTSVKLDNESDEVAGLSISGTCTITKFIVQGMLEPTADCGFILDIPHKPKGVSAILKPIITDFFERRKIHLSWSTSRPWAFNDFSRDTAKFTLMSFEREPMNEPVRSTGSGYNPRAEFDARPGEAARQARVRGSAYSDSFGGDSSNYRR